MNAFSTFRDADTLHVESLDFELDGPKEIAGHTTRPPMCVEKAVGDDGFTLSALQHLALYASTEITVSFDEDAPSEQHDNPDILLHFVPEGEAVALAGGQVRQVFAVDARPNEDIRYAGYDVHVDRITGRIVLDFVERVPWVETTSCKGQRRYARVGIVSVAGESRLDISGSASGFDTTIHLTGLRLSGTGAAPGFAVGIHPHRDECGRVGVVPGGTQRFWASVGSPPPGGRTFTWTVQGATIVGPATLPHLQVQLSTVPDPDPDPVHVQVQVDIGSISAGAAIDFHPDTPRSRWSKSLRCKVQQLVRRNFLADPLWDPLRDHVTRPIDRVELQRAREAAAELLREIDGFLGQMSK